MQEMRGEGLRGKQWKVERGRVKDQRDRLKEGGSRRKKAGKRGAKSKD